MCQETYLVVGDSKQLEAGAFLYLEPTVVKNSFMERARSAHAGRSCLFFELSPVLNKINNTC